VASPLAYVDASAFVKLIVPERESQALLTAAKAWQFASSTVLEVEAVRAVRRRAPGDEPAVRTLLHSVDMVEISAEIRGAAATLADPHLRSLDAIHLSTALSLGERCGTVFTYDERLIAAAQAHGLTVSVPQP
jgi:predicted nucleic acid-binding protein